jgi:hypothetical protein
MAEIMASISKWMEPKMVYICLAIVATLLSIFSGDINGQVRKLLKGSHFMVRFGAFVLLCAFGYGMLTVFAASLLRQMLLGLDRVWMAPMVVLCFVVIGLLAERRNHV